MVKEFEPRSVVRYIWIDMSPCLHLHVHLWLTWVPECVFSYSSSKSKSKLKIWIALSLSFIYLQTVALFCIRLYTAYKEKKPPSLWSISRGENELRPTIISEIHNGLYYPIKFDYENFHRLKKLEKDTIRTYIWIISHGSLPAIVTTSSSMAYYQKWICQLDIMWS